LEAVTLWKMARTGAFEVTVAAANALADGLDSPSLRMLAGTSRGMADIEVSEFWPKVRQELDLHDPDARLSAYFLARDLLRYGTRPRQIARELTHHFGYEGDDEAWVIMNVDEDYERANPGDSKEAELDGNLYRALGRLLEAYEPK
jgi:hypothetical protein